MMKLTGADWKKLQTSMLVFAAVLLVMTIIVYYAQHKKIASMQALDKQKTLLTQAINRYQSSGSEKASIIQYLPQYQQLISQGVVGEERRLAWVDAVRNIHKNEKLFSIKYSIGAQEQYKPAFSLNVGQFKITHSLMRIELAMLHEGDLLTLLGGLATQQSAPFIVKQCEMLRLNTAIGTTLTPNIQAKCELDWITIHEPISTHNVLLPANKIEGEAS